MKTISVLSYERAGTTWLCTVLNTRQTWCVFEIFSRNPALYYWNFLTLLKHKQCLPQPAIDVFAKIFHPQNFFVDALSFTKIKTAMLETQPFCMDLLRAFRDEAYASGRMFCFKIFPYHLERDITADSIYDLSDYIIINYRNNILETFLSWKLAIKTGAWTSEDKQDRFAVPNVAWDEQEYMSFYYRISSYINFWKKLASNKPHSIIVYEDIHSHKSEQDKAIYIQKKIMQDTGMKIDVSVNNQFKKQRDYTNLNSIISNYEDFQISMNKKIPTLYT